MNVEVLCLTVTAWSFLALAIIYLTVGITREFFWLGRGDICYDNFEQKEKYYAVRTRPWSFILLALLALAAAVLICGIHHYTKNNTAELQPLNAVAIIGVSLGVIVPILEATRKKNNCNLAKVKELYLQVKKSFSNHEQLELNLEEYKHLRNQLAKKNAEISALFRGFSAVDLGMDLEPALGDLDALILDCESKKSGFNSADKTRFDEILSKFLQVGFFDKSAFGTVFFFALESIEKIEAATIARRNKAIARCAAEILQKDCFAASEGIESLFTLLEQLHIPRTEKILSATFSYLDVHREQRGLILPGLLVQPECSAGLLAATLQKAHYFWLLEFEFSLGIPAWVKVGEELLLANGAAHISHYLKALGADAKNVLAAVLGNSSQKNAVREIFLLRYAFLLGKPPYEGSDSKMHEDLYLTLTDYAKANANQTLLEELMHLSPDGQGADGKRLEELMTECRKEHTALLTAAERVMLHYMVCQKTDKYIERKEVLALYYELCDTLRMKEMYVLCLLLLALILLCEGEKNSAAARNIAEEYREVFSGVSFRDAAEVLRALEDNRTAKMTMNTVGRIEKGRLLYERLGNFKGGDL